MIYLSQKHFKLSELLLWQSSKESWSHFLVFIISLIFFLHFVTFLSSCSWLCLSDGGGSSEPWFVSRDSKVNLILTDTHKLKISISPGVWVMGCGVRGALTAPLTSLFTLYLNMTNVRQNVQKPWDDKRRSSKAMLAPELISSLSRCLTDSDLQVFVAKKRPQWKSLTLDEP